ncbi:UTP--glucose-1-phosphate uridylyltransferase [Pontibacter ummariensis]|uniref:UTP--glucose-1-phosphate uridylyltransferase n=1 Tax=Pontibacter ummariensis TaxID=1610492 RepID=A0A239D5Z6_9BACT|nr:sugar phosphate nucleotidyltransferase [Pontibacter ummariensis]PRY14264.1 UTP--glucose-1-phosphate uridylyltransferase [Pontibacter ummariensis]SNS27707.1 UTP--glucose-1-phosphate uridylyltransferase [Pontibacter ummariensis]
MRIKKAVITAAARGERLYPVADTIQKAMLPVVDVDGLHKPVIQIIAEEAFASGIEELCIVCAPGDGVRYESAFTSLRDNLVKSFKGVDWARKEAEKVDQLLSRIQFLEQEQPLGYGHAVYCAREFVRDEPFLLLLGDYLYVSNLAQQRCAAQLLELASQENCAVSAVNPTIEHQIGRYGTLTGKHLPGKSGVYKIEKIIEKPSLSVAELELQTPGLRAGYYLCFFGMHVLTPAVFDILQKEVDRDGDNILLTPALQELADTEKYLALEVKGNRYDISRKHGLLSAQIALGLAGEAHEETLTTMVELLAEANMRSGK